MDGVPEKLSLIVVGASGDLARRKIFPALFALYSQGYLPKDVNIFGFARSPFTGEAFRARLAESLTCRYVPGQSCGDWIERFLSRCHYVAGKYDSRESFLDLYEAMRPHEPGADASRVFYLAITPSVFLDVARAMAGAGLVTCGANDPWTRVVIEKPFGRDRASSDLLTAEMGRVFHESQIYRIDHYLGKEVVQNLMVLRFANAVFEPVWNRAHVEKVHIRWAENIGVEGRGGYYDEYGIVRDVVQNHLLQILTLIAMERPASLSPRDIQDQKLQVLAAIPPLSLADIAIGQYAAGTLDGRPHPGYAEEESIPRDSITPTYASAVLQVANQRWHGVPFVISAGKGLDRRVSEVEIAFRPLCANVFCPGSPCPPANRLVIRIQPDEALRLRIVSKEPGLSVKLVETDLNLKYESAFSAQIPDAYECLLLDVIQGDKSLFIRSDELAAAWDVFTPVLHEIEEQRIRPEPYPFGSPESAVCRAFRRRHGIDE